MCAEPRARGALRTEANTWARVVKATELAATEE